MVEQAREFVWSDADQVPLEVRRATLCFDPAVRNGDRQLHECGGNPNMLAQGSGPNLWLIDHNLAFGKDSVEEIAANHAFTGSVAQAGASATAEVADKVRRAMGLAWPRCWGDIPEEWTDSPASLRRDLVEEILSLSDAAVQEVLQR